MTTLNAVLKSPDFPCDYLQISRVEGREAISQLFSFTIDVICTEPDDFTFELLGLRASLVFENDGEEVRAVHGIIARADEIFTTKQGNYTTAYRLVLVPAVWRLTLTDLQQVYLNTFHSGHRAKQAHGQRPHGFPDEARIDLRAQADGHPAP